MLQTATFVAYCNIALLKDEREVILLKILTTGYAFQSHWEINRNMSCWLRSRKQALLFMVWKLQMKKKATWTTINF